MDVTTVTEAGGYVFISYARADVAYVDRLVAHLRANEVGVWLDRLTPGGAPWLRMIQSRVEHASAVVLIVSPRAADSDWVLEELLLARRVGVPVLPLVIEGEPWLGVQQTQ